MNIHEVAEAAGVSVATVSRVINHPEIVAEKTRERVLAVLKRTSYAANAEPRSRRARKKHAIALILPSLIEYPNVHAGVRAIAALRNCGVQLCLTGYDEADAARNIRALAAQQIDGAILAMDSGAGAAAGKLREAGIPVVLIGGRRSPGDENMCYINYQQSAHKLAQYAADTGNASAVLLLDRQDSDVKASLLEGFRQRAGRVSGRVRADRGRRARADRRAVRRHGGRRAEGGGGEAGRGAAAAARDRLSRRARVHGAPAGADQRGAADLPARHRRRALAVRYP